MTGPTVPDQGPEPLLDLQRLGAGIRWRRRTWWCLALVGLVLGAALAALLPARSTAVAQVFVVHEDESGDRETLTKTDLAVLGTTRIAAAALADLGLDERPEDFAADYAGASDAANVLRITARADSDAEAVARAGAVAEAFIADHVRRSREGAEAEAAALLDRRAEVAGDLDLLDREIAAATAPSAPAALAAQIEQLYGRRSTLTSQITDLERRAEEAEIGAPRVAAGTVVIDAPHATTRPLPVAAAVGGAIGLLLGLGLGLAVCAVATVVRDRPVLRRDIAAHLGASVVAQLPRPVPWRRRSSAAAERRRAATTLARLVRDGPGSASVLQLGCRSTAAALALDVAAELAADRPVVLVDDLPGAPAAALARERAPSGVDVVAATGAEPEPGGRWRLGVGGVEPGTAWTDLRALGEETLLVVRAGAASAAWLHTVARQLADSRVAVLGVVLVHPDPRDRSDGTLWDALQTALRGRPRPAGPPVPAHPVNGSAPSGNGVTRPAAAASTTAADGNGTAPAPAPGPAAPRSERSDTRPRPHPRPRPRPRPGPAPDGEAVTAGPARPRSERAAPVPDPVAGD